MNRVSLSVPRKRAYKKILKRTKGFYGRRKNCIRLAKMAYRKSLEDAYVGRKLRKRYFKSMWIKVIGIWAKSKGTSYSQVISKLLDRFKDRKSAYEAIRNQENEQHKEFFKSL